MNETNNSSLPTLLFALRRKITDSAKVNHFRQHLTLSQLEVLWFIASGQQRSMESIAHYLGIKPPSVTAMIDKMEADGLVLRKKDERDRRIINVMLSNKTQKEFSKIKAQKEYAFDTMLAKLSAADTQTLKRILLQLLED